MVPMEPAGLHSTWRLDQPPTSVREYHRRAIGLGAATSSYERTALATSSLNSTTALLDRLVAAHAMANGVPLITSDRTPLKHCPVAVWDA